MHGPPRDSRPPASLGHYRVLGLLGSGGMADVYLAEPEVGAGYVAIKRMKPALTQSREFVDLFFEEARTAALLQHPNICRVFDVASSGRDHFIVLEFLDGVPLTKLLALQLRNPNSFSVGLLVSLVEQVCRGMHYAHTLCDPHGRPYRIVHRDLSPPNLFVTAQGLVKVLDFGISKSRDSVVQTITGQIRGKFSYMSPEQLRGETLDQRSDVFALGTVLFELLSGVRLFKRRSRLDTFRAVTRDPIPRVSEYRRNVPPDLVACIDGAIQRDRDTRTPSARAFGELLIRTQQRHGGICGPDQIAAMVHQLFSEDLQANRDLTPAPPPGAADSPGLAAVDVDPTQRDSDPRFEDSNATTSPGRLVLPPEDR